MVIATGGWLGAEGEAGARGKGWGREEGGSCLWVDHRPSSSQVVGCRASWSGHNQAISLHMSHKVAVAEALQVAEERGDAAIDDHLVQDNLLIQVSIVICIQEATVVHGFCTRS